MSVVGRIHLQAPAPRSRRDNRTAILQAGRALFARHGVAGVTFEDVARETGLTRRTIYNHFANVDGLFVASIQWTLQQLKAEMPAPPPAEQPLGSALNRIVRDLLSLFTCARFADVHLALARHGAHYPVLRRAFEQQLLGPLHEAIAAYLQARRAFEFDGDPRSTAQDIVAGVLGLAETSRLLGHTSEEAIRRALPLAQVIVQALAWPQPGQLDRVA